MPGSIPGMNNAGTTLDAQRWNGLPQESASVRALARHVSPFRQGTAERGDITQARGACVPAVVDVIAPLAVSWQHDRWTFSCSTPCTRGSART